MGAVVLIWLSPAVGFTKAVLGASGVLLSVLDFDCSMLLGSFTIWVLCCHYIVVCAPLSATFLSGPSCLKQPVQMYWRKGFFFGKVWPNGFFFFKGLADPSVEFELPQAIGEGPPAGSSFAASYWGNPICGVVFCSKLLAKSHL